MPPKGEKPNIENKYRKCMFGVEAVRTEQNLCQDEALLWGVQFLACRTCCLSGISRKKIYTQRRRFLRSLNPGLTSVPN